MKNSAASSPGRRVWLHVRTRHVMFRVTSCRCLVVAVFFVFSFSFTVVTSAGCYRSNAKLLKPCKTIVDQPARSCENVRHKLSQNGQLRRLKKKIGKAVLRVNRRKKKKPGKYIVGVKSSSRLRVAKVRHTYRLNFARGVICRKRKFDRTSRSSAALGENRPQFEKMKI